MERPFMEYSQLKVKKGTILIYRVYDIGEQINLNRAESILSSFNKERLSFSKKPRKPIILSDAPVSFTLDPAYIEIGSQKTFVDIAAKIFDYGALSLCFQIKIPEGILWGDLVNLAAEIETSVSVDTFSTEKAKEISKLIEPAINNGKFWDVFEDYVIYFIESVDGIDKDCAIDLLSKADIPSLILAENKEKLAQTGRNFINDNHRQYSQNDLAVVDWNSAFIYEPTGNKDACDVIEFSLTQQLELRYYDEVLDKKLATLYDSIEKQESKRLWTETYSKLSVEASRAYVEVSEFLERLDNSLKTVGDFYLATIFRLANTRFRTEDWKKDVEKKMDTLAQISELFQAEVNNKRSHYLEIIIILMIAFEIISAMPWMKK